VFISGQQLLLSLGAMVVAYLCGAIPFGLLLGKAKGVDIRLHGSGNIGATNVGRVLGRTWGILAFFLDMLKGCLPVLGFGIMAGHWIAPHEPGRAVINLVWGAVAASCVIGHLFPVYLGFKGGKGVATSLGALLGFYPYFTLPGLIAFSLWIVLTLTTRYVSVGSVGAVAAFPIIFAAFAILRHDAWGGADELWPLHLFGTSMALLVIYRHRGNLQRLYRGVEPRIGSSTRPEHRPS
jgi:acyl phosphate:glycerol-3-phosphate acyltransferase